jgi:predicted amidophosphoribosyltransferase
VFNIFKTTEHCKACNKGEMYWYSICGLCGYHQHSCISPKLYNYLKIKGNPEKLFSKFDRRGL